MVQGSLSQEDVKENINILERLINGASSDDEYMAAMLHNQRILIQALAEPDTNTTGETSGVPPGTAGLVLEDIAEDDKGDILFKVDGRTVISNFRAGSDIEDNEVARVNGQDGKVYPLGDIDPSKLDFGDVSVTSLGGSSSSAMVGELELNQLAIVETDDLNHSNTNSDGSITVNPGEKVPIARASAQYGMLLMAIGASDQNDTWYSVEIDGDEAIEPMNSPLGQVNTPFSFVEKYGSAMKAADEVIFYAIRPSSASGPVDITARMHLEVLQE